MRVQVVASPMSDSISTDAEAANTIGGESVLERMTWSEAREHMRATEVALIPVGSTEQHGPHLPLGTDFIAANALAERVAQETGVVSTPVIPIGVSAHHRQFWGTLTVSPGTFRAYMREVALSLASHGLSRLVFVNGHGGNGPALQEVCRALRSDRLYAVVWQWWTTQAIRDLFEEAFRSRGTHAGAGETSVLWAIEPGLVRQDRFEEAARGASATFGETKHGAALPVDTLDFSESGATLDPREASEAAGRRILDAAAAELVGLVEWLASAPQEELGPRQHKE